MFLRKQRNGHWSLIAWYESVNLGISGSEVSPATIGGGSMSEKLERLECEPDWIIEYPNGDTLGWERQLYPDDEVEYVYVDDDDDEE